MVNNLFDHKGFPFIRITIVITYWEFLSNIIHNNLYDRPHQKCL
jgi:hypothetical protein